MACTLSSERLFEVKKFKRCTPNGEEHDSEQDDHHLPQKKRKSRRRNTTVIFYPHLQLLGAGDVVQTTLNLQKFQRFQRMTGKCSRHTRSRRSMFALVSCEKIHKHEQNPTFPNRSLPLAPSLKRQPRLLPNAPSLRSLVLHGPTQTTRSFSLIELHRKNRDLGVDLCLWLMP